MENRTNELDYFKHKMFEPYSNFESLNTIENFTSGNPPATFGLRNLQGTNKRFSAPPVVVVSKNAPNRLLLREDHDPMKPRKIKKIKKVQKGGYKLSEYKIEIFLVIILGTLLYYGNKNKKIIFK